MCLDVGGHHFQQLLQYQVSKVVLLKTFFKSEWNLTLDNAVARLPHMGEPVCQPASYFMNR
jgi:hypothetical protein